MAHGSFKTGLCWLHYHFAWCAFVCGSYCGNMFFTLKSLKKSTSKDLAAAFTKIRALEDQVDDLEYLINRE